MKNTGQLIPLFVTVSLALCASLALGQSTDGTVSYTVQTTAYSASYNPKQVAAVWVVDSNGKFVKTLCRHASARIAYLYKWIADRGSYTTVDGVTSATVTTQPTTHTVTWDCRGTNGQLVADGKYTFRAEYTSANAQGPYCGTLCSFTKGTSAAVSNYPSFSNGGGTFQNMSLNYKPYAEIGISALSPASGLVNSSVPVVVTVSNQTANAAAFTVAVSNLTPAATLIGTQSVASLAGKASTNVTVNWSTAGLSAGSYSLVSSVSTLATETNATDNVKTGAITLSAPTAGDVAVLSLRPSSGFVNSAVSVQLLVTNVMSAASGAFTVALSNVTTVASLIATQRVSTLAAKASTNLVFAWSTAGLAAGTYQLKGCAGPLTNETNTADNSLTGAIALRDIVHDLAINAILLPAMVAPNVTSNVVIAVTNKGDLTESFTAALVDITSSTQAIGTRSTNVAALAGVNIAIPWSTAGIPLGSHILQAGLTVVAGETNVLNNTNSVAVVVASSLTTNAVVGKSAVWKYLDKGLDISGAPWRTADYYDGFWASGPAPLGYGLPNVATTIGYGGAATNRYITTYFRREFTLDAVPMTVTGRMMRTHGAVLYLNGTEIARQNLPAGTLAYADKASATVSGEAATNYFAFSVPAGALAAGRNLLTAELHLAAATNATAGFGVELTTVTPTVPPTYAVAPTALTPDGDAQTGDAPAVSVTLANTGSATATCLVLIRDAATGAVLASQTVGPLVPGESVVARLPLSTFGAATGSRTLQAVTVCNGVTNLANVATAPFALSAPVFTAQPVPAAGSIGGRCNAVAVSGRYVYLGCGSTLELWDALTPSAPVRRASLRLPGIIESLATSNSWVYAATGAAGVQIVDAAAITQMVHRATYDTTGHARRLALSGNLLYVADGPAGVRIIDVTAPASPVLAGAYQTVGPAQTVTPAAPRLLVLDSYYGLQNLHAAQPSALAVTGTLSQITSGLALAPASGAVLASDANGGLFRIDTTVPAVPAVADSVLLPAAGLALATSGPALYVAAGPQGLLTLNASTLDLAAANTVGDEACDLAVAGPTLYVAAGFAGCQALNISSPLAPQPLGVFRTGARPVDAAAAGTTLYIAAGEGGLQIHSLQSPALPTLLGSVTSVSNARCVAVAFPTAVVADSLNRVSIFDVTIHDAPALKGSYTSSALSLIRRVALAGDRAALTDGRRIELISLGATPALLAAQEPGGFVFDLAAIPGEVYAACGGAGLKALRMDTLGLDSTYVTPGPATGVSAVSNRLYVACGQSGWQTLNIDNAANPVWMQTTAASQAFGVAAAGPLVYLADAARSVQSMNVSAPLSPVSGASFTRLTRALRVRAAGGLALAAEDEAGLAILNASPGDINLNGIPDSWEQQIVTASLSTNGAVRGVLDVDLTTKGPNGYTYFQSYLAGLTPTDPNSVLAISSITPASVSGTEFVIRWSSVPGKTYTLYKSTDLRNGFVPVQAGITATGTQASATDSITSPRAFYTVVVEP